MATTFLEPGGDADFGTGLWAAVTGAAIATDFIHGGHIKSIKFRPSTSDFVVSPNSIISDSGGRISFYLYLNVLPSGNANFIQVQNGGSGNGVFQLSLTSAGVLRMEDSNGAQIGSNGSTLTAGTWNRISIAYTISSTTVNRIEQFVNGVSSISITNATLINTGTSRIKFANNNTDSLLDFRISDIYVDNSSTLTDTVNAWVTAKRPNANGTTNGFTTQIGSGGSGYGTGHSPQVNERANSDVNGWSIATVASAITEEYNIESVSQGDIDISGSTIIDYMGWIRTKALASETAQIIVNNANTNVSITTSIAFYTQIAGSTTYPAGTGTDIGEISATIATTISLYECGIIVAYVPSTTKNMFMTTNTKFWGM